MSEPRILHENILSPLNCEESAFYYPHELAGALNSLTYEYWKFTSLQASVTFTNTENLYANCLGIVANGLAGATVTISGSNDGVSYSTLASELFIEDGAQMIFLDAAVNYAFFRFTFGKSLAVDTLIRNLSFGQYMQFERCLMQSHAPAPYQRKNEFVTNISGDGNLLGRSIKKFGVETSLSFSMITAAWGRADFQKFVENALAGAYYLAWNPGLYPQEVVFGWTDDDIGLKYTGDGNLMAASWKVKGWALDRTVINLSRARITADRTRLRVTTAGNLRIVTGV